MIRIKQKTIKFEFQNAEMNFKYCWDVLCDLKLSTTEGNEFGNRMIAFQEKLAESIFKLHKLREDIIKEEKYTIQNKSRYKFNWFKERLKLLSIYKKGIDNTVNIAKSLGDAFAYFFYQFDTNLLEEHLSHQRIINSTAGIGELGELEFLKQIKHIEGRLTLYHGITNILRYGDFSFFDFLKFQIVELGELKTKKIDDGTIELNLTLLRHSRIKSCELSKSNLNDEDLKKNRRGRQKLEMINFLKRAKETKNAIGVDLTNNYYFNEINDLFKSTKNRKTVTTQVSDGLAFSGSKFERSSLYNKIFVRNPAEVINKHTEEFVNSIKKLMSSTSNNNGLIIGQLLYNPDFTDKNTPGTVPLFWYPLNLTLLKKLYFLEFYVFSFFNPAHLIETIQKQGFFIESKYAKKKKPTDEKYMIQRFDLFISYINNFLQTESFVIDTINKIQNYNWDIKPNQVLVKPQQHFPTHH